MKNNFKIFTNLVLEKPIYLYKANTIRLNLKKMITNENITVRLVGTVKDIVLKKDSKIFLNRKILGDIVNEAGETQIFNQDQK